ncbi:protein kinase domain-containing protein [Piscirickettsia salmonis]|uniref:protein kinase domain-containing protein n=1 Tax=Piscirickettsia salmonis TaxID=1238 RepID=UPI0007C8CCF3
MPSVIWYSKEQKAKEWSVANHLLANACNGTKIKRSHQKIPISYPDPSQPGSRVYLNHSFIKVGDKVLVMAGEGNYLGEGKYGKVKLAEDEQGHLYVLKINHAHTSINELEKNIAKDMSVFHGEARRLSSQAAFKQVIALSYLGKDLEKIKNLNLENKSTDYIGFLAVDEILKLHKGELSAKGIKYIHADLKLDNLSLAPDGQRLHLLDYGLSVPASNGAFGLRRAHERVVITDKYYQYAPETRNGKCEFSYQSDIFSLGNALEGLLTADSALQPIVRLMYAEKPALRPSLELVKVAFLAEVYKDSNQRLSQMLVEYNCVITEPALARKALRVLTDPQKSFLLTQSINNLIVHLHPRSLTTADWQLLLENQQLQKVVVKLDGAKVNFKGQWQNLILNSSLQKAILSLDSSKANLTRDLQRLLDERSLQKAVAVLDKMGVSLKKNCQCLLASDDLQRAVILLDEQNINFKDKWQDLVEKPGLQKIINDFSNSSFGLAKNLRQLLDNYDFQQAIIVLDKAGVNFKRSWLGLFINADLQKVVIALDQAGINLKESWQELLSNPDLREAVMVLTNANVDLSANWQQLLENKSLQKMVLGFDEAGFNSTENLQQLLESANLQKSLAVLNKVGVDVNGNYQALLEKPHLQKALAAANDYLSCDFSHLGSSHGYHGKSQTEQFVRHLMAREDKSECGVKMEMSQWVKGYGTFARSSSTQTLSRLDFACDSGLFPSPSATLFFAMSQADRVAMKQEVVSFSGK